MSSYHDEHHEEAGDPQADEQPRSMSLSSISGMSESDVGIEGFDSDEPSGNDLSKVTQHGAFALVVVAVLAAAVLGGMHMLQSRITMPAFDSEITAKVEQAFLRVQNGDDLSAPAVDTGEPIDLMLAKLTTEPPQVEIEYVQKNPFLMPYQKKAPQVQQVDDEAQRARERERRKAQLLREAREYHVDMIMAGSDEKAAVIDGEIRKVGERLGSFVIETIDSQRVTMLADGTFRVRLKMSN